MTYYNLMQEFVPGNGNILIKKTSRYVLQEN
jgi:hypothetical protein